MNKNWGLSIGLLATLSATIGCGPDSSSLPVDTSSQATTIPDESFGEKSATADDPVHCELRIPGTVSAGAEFVVQITLSPQALYEIKPLDDSVNRSAIELGPTTLNLTLPQTWVLKGPWKSPPAQRSAQADRHLVHEGPTPFERTVVVPQATPRGNYLMLCTVTYQACNARQCLRNQTHKLSMNINVVD